LFNWEIALHRHQSYFFQILPMSCGAGEFRVETDKFSIGPAVLLMVPPRAVHEFRFSENVEGYVVTARIERIEQMLNGCSGIRAFFNTARRACAGLQHVLSWIDREVGFHPTTRLHVHMFRLAYPCEQDDDAAHAAKFPDAGALRRNPAFELQSDRRGRHRSVLPRYMTP